MKFLAWLYLKAPIWLVRLVVPYRVNYATEGRFNDELERVYNKRAARQNRRANEKLRRRQTP